MRSGVNMWSLLVKTLTHRCKAISQLIKLPRWCKMPMRSASSYIYELNWIELIDPFGVVCTRTEPPNQSIDDLSQLATNPGLESAVASPVPCIPTILAWRTSVDWLVPFFRSRARLPGHHVLSNSIEVLKYSKSTGFPVRIDQSRFFWDPQVLDMPMLLPGWLNWKSETMGSHSQEGLLEKTCKTGLPILAMTPPARTERLPRLLSRALITSHQVKPNILALLLYKPWTFGVYFLGFPH